MAEKLPDKFGIDFGNHSIKAVYLKGIDSPKPELINFGSAPTPFGVLNTETDIHIDRLASVVRNLVKEANIKTKAVVSAIPESVVSTRVSTFKGIKPKELNDAVYWDTKQSLPVPIEEMEISWMLLGEKKETEEYMVLRVAATKKMISTYTKILQKAGLDPVAMETEGVAIARLVKQLGQAEGVVVLDFGSQTTDMSIVRDGNLLFSQSISTGSDAFTHAIMNDFSLEYNQAEQYKIKYGLDETQLEGKIYKSLEPIAKIIVGEVVRGIEFYKSQTGFSAPRDVYLVGDGSLLPNLVVYMTTELGLNVTLTNPWSNISVKESDMAVLDKSKSAYAVCVGLALRSF